MSRTKQPAIVNISEEIKASTYLAQGRSNIRTQEQTDIVRLGNIETKPMPGKISLQNSRRKSQITLMNGHGSKPGLLPGILMG